MVHTLEKIKQRYSSSTITSNKKQYLLLFIFSCLIDISFGYIPNIVYSLTLFLLLLLIITINRKLYFVVTLFLTLLAALYFPIGQIFGRPDDAIISAAFFTDKNEANEFLSTIPWLYYVGSVLIVILWVFVVKLKLSAASFVTKRKKLLIFFIVISILSSPLKKVLFKSEPFSLSEIGFTPIKFLLEGYRNFTSIRNDFQEYKNTLNKKDTWKNVFAHPHYKTFIIVIGESVRSDFMHTYGFKINNTPFSDRSNGLFFENYLSAGGNTILSLTHTLAKYQSNAVQLENNILSLAKKAGFSTWWISNQGYLGVFDSLVSIIGESADKAVFLQLLDLARFKNAKDNELLPFVRNALHDSNNKPKLIVIHLIGSHPPVCKRVNSQFNVYFHSKELSCYVQSMRNTDTLLENIVSLAKSNSNSWSMMYFSDHGLAYTKNMLHHSDEFQQNYRVPMFIISSDDTQKRTITAYRSALNFPLLFSQWTGIHAQGLQTTCHYLSNEPCQNQNNTLLSDRTLKDVRTLPENLISDA